MEDCAQKRRSYSETLKNQKQKIEFGVKENQNLKINKIFNATKSWELNRLEPRLKRKKTEEGESEKDYKFTINMNNLEENYEDKLEMIVNKLINVKRDITINMNF
jgi:hypothetical protein